MICKNENLPLKTEVVEEIIKVSKGDMRKSINSLQNVYLFANHQSALAMNIEGVKDCSQLEVDDFYRIIGSISPREVELIFQLLLKESYSECRVSELIRSQRHFGNT